MPVELPGLAPFTIRRTLHLGNHLPMTKVIATVEGMDKNQAQQFLAEVQAAQAASGLPRPPVGLALVAALAAGSGVALVGQPSTSGWLHACLLVAGVALIALAFAIPVIHRARVGLHGFAGRVKSDNLVFLLCAVSLLINGIHADRALGLIYLGIGVVVAVGYFLLLTRPVRTT